MAHEQVVGGARGKAASAYTRVSRTVKRGALKLFEVTDTWLGVL